jgi:hypothetical protein
MVRQLRGEGGGFMAGSADRKPAARRLLAALAVVVALALGAGTAWATVIERGHYSGTEPFTDNGCGFTLNGVSTFHGQALLRVAKGGQAFLVKDTFFFRDVLTNPDTGKWFVIRGHGVFHEIKATLVSGTIYEFVAIEAGQPFVIEDSAGHVVVRDRGVIRHTYLFDTLGDSTPGGIFLGETGTIVHGPHPGFADDFPFCEIAADLTGA